MRKSHAGEPRRLSRSNLVRLTWAIHGHLIRRGSHLQTFGRLPAARTAGGCFSLAQRPTTVTINRAALRDEVRLAASGWSSLLRRLLERQHLMRRGPRSVASFYKPVRRKTARNVQITRHVNCATPRHCWTKNMAGKSAFSSAALGPRNGEGGPTNDIPFVHFTPIRPR